MLAQSEEEEEEEEEDEDEDEGMMPALGATSSSPQDSEGSRSQAQIVMAQTEGGNNNEYICVDLSDIRKDLQCPICLGIIRKTRTVMECLHRFCRECIDKSMRLGNNECPVCRTHCASRRSLRDDLNFDALVVALYPDLDSYEEEELALQDEEKHRNRQLQVNIAEILVRQSDAIARRCTAAKTTAAAIVRKAHSKIRKFQGRNRARNQGQDSTYSSTPEDEDRFMASQQNDRMESADEGRTDKRIQRRKRKAPSYLLDDSVRISGSSDDEQAVLKQGKALNKVEVRSCEDRREASITDGGKEALVTWARGGARSHVRYGSVTNNSNKKLSQSKRATSLFDALTAAKNLEKVNEFQVHFTLQPFSEHDNEEDKLPSLEKPNLCCPANVTVDHICMYLVARLYALPTMQLELVVGNKVNHPEEKKKGKGQILGAEVRRATEVLHPNVTLGQIHSYFWESVGNMVLMYRAKLTSMNKFY